MALELRRLQSKETDGYEEVWVAEDTDAAYQSVLAIHDTRRGPALGGTRLMAYRDLNAALYDVLRLARGMTFKCAAADLPLGGGKSVVFQPAGAFNRSALLRAHGRAVEALEGRYITSVDIGTGPEDMVTVRETTRYVTGLPGELDDPSPVTARGVVRAIQAAWLTSTSRQDLDGVRVAIQGCGHVGRALARQLDALGARLVVSDVDARRVTPTALGISAEVCPPDEIHRAEVDVFAPCSTGGILNDTTISQLEARIVAGAANNQLELDRHADALRARSITYVPDFIANAGGAIYLCRTLAGWSQDRTSSAVEAIFETTRDVLALAERAGTSTARAADELVLTRLQQ
jgi:leucine dehydrogenase